MRRQHRPTSSATDSPNPLKPNEKPRSMVYQNTSRALPDAITHTVTHELGWLEPVSAGSGRTRSSARTKKNPLDTSGLSDGSELIRRDPDGRKTAKK